MNGKLISMVLMSASMWISGHSQPSWSRVNPLPTGTTLHGVCFANEFSGWVVGSLGVVARTTDGGVTWEEQSLRPRGEFQKVDFVDPLHGVIVGGDIGAVNGAVFVSSDGGQTWTDRYPHGGVRYAFFDLSFTTALAGFICGFEGIFKTVDGGLSWQECEPSSELAWITTITFVDDSTGWAANPGGRIWKTTNGGDDWFVAADLGWRWFERIRFFDRDTGWVAGGGLYSQGGMIMKTTDGGTTWTLQDSTDNNKYHDIRVTDALNVLAVGEAGWAKYTTDGGTNWFNAPTNSSDELFGIGTRSNETWVVGGGYNYPKLYSTDDINTVWDERSSYLTLASLSTVEFSDERYGWAAGNGGALLRTADGGITWSVQNVFSVDFSDLAVPSDLTTFASSLDGRLAKTTDGGASWTIGPVPGAYSIHEVDFVTDSIGWLIEDFGPLRKTTDGGTSWNDIHSGGSDFFFYDETLGWVLQPIITMEGEGETILFRTTDGGLSWVDTTMEGTVQGLMFPTPSHGWMVKNGSVYVSTDAGVSWIFRSSFPLLAGVIADFFAVSETEAWAVGDETLYHTTDGGMKFDAFTGIPWWGIRHLHFSTPLLGFGVGEYGSMMRYEGMETSIGLGPRGDLLPERHFLYQNYPNPFNPKTTITFSLPISAEVDLRIFNLLGEEVATLVSRDYEAGTHSIQWDATGQPSGMYFYRLRAGEFVETRKLVLVR